MASVNKVILIGNLGADPETRVTQNGTSVCSFRIATTDIWSDREGNRQERTEWHRIVAWGKLGEICGQYLRKGKQVYVEGRLQTRQWEDRDGGKRYTTEIVAQTMQMLGRPGDTEGGPRAAAGAAGAAGGRGGQAQADGGFADDVYPPAPGPGAEEDDLPF